jgi:uncharacterized protein YggE
VNSNIISVKGNGKLKISPNLAIVDLEIEVENKNHETAYEKYKNALNRLNEKG